MRLKAPKQPGSGNPGTEGRLGRNAAWPPRAVPPLLNPEFVGLQSISRAVTVVAQRNEKGEIIPETIQAGSGAPITELERAQIIRELRESGERIQGAMAQEPMVESIDGK